MAYKWDTVGHEKQIAQLEAEIAANKLTHAYLFSGAKQTGKFRLAKKFGEIIGGEDADTIMMNDEGQTLKIDEVRELVRKTNLTTGGGKRIVLIQNIERMPIEAQNSFLKTLEEPAGDTIFIMTTNFISKVLPTIQSRVRNYHFPSVSNAKLKSYLVEKYGEKSQIDEIVSIAQGQPGLAIDLMEDSAKLAAMREVYVQVESFLKSNDLSRKFAFIEQISADAEESDQFIEAFTRYLRTVLYEYVQEEDHPMKKRFSLEDIVNLFESLDQSRYLMQRNVNKKLVLENLLIKTEV